jgi:hypothetical protein
MSSDIERVERVQERHEAELMATPGVVGVGVGERHGRPVLLVMVKERTPEVDRLPQQIEGVPVEIEVTGEIEAL